MKGTARVIFAMLAIFAAPAERIRAEPPSVSYIFPAGGQRGTAVSFKVGGHYLYDSPPFAMFGSGVEAPQHIEET